MTKKKIVLFDFDGVIADTFDMNFKINRDIDHTVKTEDDYRKRFDGNINNWEKDLGKSLEEVKKADEEFLARYMPKMAEAQVFSGMKEVLAELAESYVLIIISSTVASAIKDFLERHGLAQNFEQFDGDNIIHRNKTDRIKMVFKKYGAGPGDCVFITDTVGDMREAAVCGIGSIGISWGFQKTDNLVKGNPAVVANNPKELLAAVGNYFKQNNG